MSWKYEKKSIGDMNNIVELGSVKFLLILRIFL